MSDTTAPKRRRSTRQPITIREVARRAEVSTATVSRTLASPEVVSPEARARVLAAISATGYTPNVAARNLRARRTKMVLVVVPNIANPFFAEILRGIDDELVASGYGIIIGNLDNLTTRESRYVDLVFAGQVDGVLSMSARVPSANGRLDERGRPAHGDHLRGHSRVRAAVRDGRQPQGRRSPPCEHLTGSWSPALRLHRRPGGQHERRGAPRRVRAQGSRPPASTLATRSTGRAISISSSAWRQGGTFWRAPIARRAIFAASDFMAIGFMKTVSLGGVRVPQDVSVVGFDGIEFSDFVTPQLTTVSQPRHELGRVGARMLIKALNGSSTRGGVYLDAPLLLRGSTASAPG